LLFEELIEFSPQFFDAMVFHGAFLLAKRHPSGDMKIKFGKNGGCVQYPTHRTDRRST
jgi:hypothetical protein